MNKWLFLVTLLLLGCNQVIEPLPPEEPANELLNRLLSQTPQATITLHVTSFINETKFQTVVTQYVSPQGLRTSSAEVIEGKQVMFDDISTEQGTYSCVKDGGWVCYKHLPPDIEVPNSTEPQLPEPQVSRLASRTIAGLEGDCFLVRGEFFSDELCVSQQGIILYKKSSFGNDYVEERVTSVQDFVPQSIFLLPGEVIE